MRPYRPAMPSRTSPPGWWWGWWPATPAWCWSASASTWPMRCRGRCSDPASTPPRPGPPSRRCWYSPWTTPTSLLTLLTLVLGASYVLRVAVLVGLTVAGPLALAGHALPQTEALARWWWRGVTACLAIPVAQSLALITALRVFFHADQDRVLGLGAARLVDLLVATCL